MINRSNKEMAERFHSLLSGLSDDFVMIDSVRTDCVVIYRRLNRSPDILFVLEVLSFPYDDGYLFPSVGVRVAAVERVVNIATQGRCLFTAQCPLAVFGHFAPLSMAACNDERNIGVLSAAIASAYEKLSSFNGDLFRMMESSVLRFGVISTAIIYCLYKAGVPDDLLARLKTGNCHEMNTQKYLLNYLSKSRSSQEALSTPAVKGQ